MTTFTHRLFLGGFAWLLLAGIALFYVLPWVPRSTSQWLLLSALGPPLFIVGEAVGGWIFSEKHGRVISRRRLSILRIGIGVLIGAIWLAITLWIGGNL